MKSWRPAAFTAILFVNFAFGQNNELPAEFEQLLPKGRIAGIVEPIFVTAADADIEPDSWILGIAVNDVARAYSLNLLNRYEVVNDMFGDKPIAAVW